MSRPIPGFTLDVVTQDGGRALVAVHGELDCSNAPELERCLGRLAGTGSLVVELDLHDVAFVDSSGLAALIQAWKDSRHAGGDLVLLSPTPGVFRVLEISGLNRIFTIRDPAAAAS